jgi:type IV pilus assembly protein PilX
MRTHMKVLRSTAARHRQHGAVLIVALLFLVILTLLGLTAMSGTTMEERMSGNSRDMNIALQAAEAALRDARRDINRLPINGAGREVHTASFGNRAAVGSCNTGDARGLCLPVEPTYAPGSSHAVMPPPLEISSGYGAFDIGTQTFARYGDFTLAPPLRATVEGTRNQPLAEQPRYIIEHFCLPTMIGDTMGGPPEVFCKFYRITARGYGVNPNSQVTLQEMFLSL